MTMQSSTHPFKAMAMITGWWYTYPSEKYEFVSWDNEIPNIWKIQNIPNHQPDYLKGRMWLVTYRNSRTSRWPDDLAEFRNDFRPNRHRLLWTMEDLPATWHVIYVGHIWGLWVIHGELTQVISHFFHVNPGFIEFINPKTAWLGSYHFKYVKSIRLPMITTIWGLPP